MELSKRMASVAALVPSNTVVCDVGCDHGFVSIYLVERKICPRAIALDINAGPLERAKEHIQEAVLSDYIETRLSDGAKALDAGEVDGLIIAGMGGRLTVKILSDSIEKIAQMSYLVLQPQSEISVVREYLRQQHFQILMEDMVYEDGKFYPMILVNIKSEDQIFYEELIDIAAECLGGEADPETVEALADQFGPCLMVENHPILEEYLGWWKDHQKQILSQVEKHPERKEQVLEELEKIELVKKIMECM